MPIVNLIKGNYEHRIQNNIMLVIRCKYIITLSVVFVHYIAIYNVYVHNVHTYVANCDGACVYKFALLEKCFL